MVLSHSLLERNNLSLPEISHFYDVRASIRAHGWRSVSTSSKIAMNCRTCLLGAIKVGGACLGGPKLITLNPDLRTPLDDFVSKTFFPGAISAESQYTCNLAYEIRQYDKNANIFGEDGQAQRTLCEQWFKDAKLPIPPKPWWLGGDFNHNVDW